MQSVHLQSRILALGFPAPYQNLKCGFEDDYEVKFSLTNNFLIYLKLHLLVNRCNVGSKGLRPLVEVLFLI